MNYRVYIKTPGYVIGESSVVITGLVPSLTDAVPAGIKFKFESDATEYTISSAVNSDTNGEATIAFTPSLAINATTELPLLFQSPRDLTSAVKTHVVAQVAKFVYAMQFEFSDQTVCINDSTQDLRFFNPELGIPAIDGSGQTGTSLNIKNCEKNTVIFKDNDSFYIDTISQQYTINTSLLNTTLTITDIATNWSDIRDTIVSYDAGYSAIKTIIDSSIKDASIVSWHDFASDQDFSDYDNLKFQVQANYALKSGDLMLVLSTRKNCRNVIDYFPIPELEANTWSSVDYTLPFKDSNIMGVIKSLGIMLNTTLANTTTLYLRAITTTTSKITSTSSGTAVLPVSPAVASPTNNLVLHRNWSGVGGYFGFDSIMESSDLKGNYVEIKLAACDQSVLQILLTQNYIGRLFRGYKLYLDAGNIVSKPIILHIGYMHGGFEFNSEYDSDSRVKTDTLSGRIQDILSARRKIVGIQTNSESLNLVHPGDKFFKEVPSLVNKSIVWGKKADSGGGMCLLATATFKIMKKADDCEELSLLRYFRDYILLESNEGMELAKDYKLWAQRYVDYIETKHNKLEYYNNVYILLLKAVKAIRRKEYKKAINTYYKIIAPLKHEIMHAKIN